MRHHPHHDPLIFGHFLLLEDLAPIRAVSRAWRARLGAGRYEVWMWHNQLVRSWSHLVHRMCARGALAAAKWLAAAFRLTARNVPMAELLTKACASHDIAVVAWAVVHFEIAIDDLPGPFSNTCDFHDLAISMWLVNYFASAIDKIKANAVISLHRACGRGDLAVALWLDDQLALPVSFLVTNFLGALGSAYWGGHLHVVYWLVTRYNLSLSDIIHVASIMPNDQSWVNRSHVRRWVAYHFSEPCPTGSLLPGTRELSLLLDEISKELTGRNRAG